MNISKIASLKARANTFLLTMYDEFAKKWTPMTEDNCADFSFMSVPTEKPTLVTKLVFLLRFLTSMIKLLTKVITSEISLVK